MAFYPGQKVVCVDADSDAGWLPCAILEKGRIYTIRQLGETGRGELGFRLIEAELTALSFFIGKNTKRPIKDNFYRAARFRPIVERKTDISVFTEILRKATKRQGADA